jgi:hypothetical protein
MTDPQKVLALYQSTLNKPQILLEDLYVYDSSKKPVIDPSTGRPLYNPLNKWNRGPLSTALQGGAMHLTSTPNTLQTEIGLGAGATVQRRSNNTNAGALICCSQYGQPHRNSDPNIGFSINQLVGLGNAVTLTNPPGLYIQMPNFGAYTTPDGSDAAQYWTIVRGTTTLNGPDGKPLPGNFILHAKFEVPKEKGFTVSDIKINGSNIQWGGQIAQTFSMHINGTGLGQSVPSAQPCAQSATNVTPQPLQMFHASVFWGYYGTPVENPVGQAMNLASNSTFIAPIVEQGQSMVPLVLTVSGVTLGPKGELPSVTFDGGDITATVGSYGGHGPLTDVNYAVPGNSYPSDSQALQIIVNVAAGARVGLRTVFVANAGQAAGPGMPAMLNIVASGSIAKGAGSPAGAKGSSQSTTVKLGARAATGMLSGFQPPANQQDFPPATQKSFDAMWTAVISASTAQAIVGNPWTSTNDCNRAYYYDPLVTPPSGAPTPVEWGAFPNRLNVYFGPGGSNPYQLTEAQLWELADTGKVAGVAAFKDGFAQIPSAVCPSINWSQPKTDWQDFGPPGPRGWMDEYCEWSVTRNASGKIVRVDFTCENPEYWLNAWRTDPNVVLGIYRQCVSQDVQLTDLCLLDAQNKPVIDPVTGKPAYQPLNKWNRGSVSSASGGGAMHLTSPPNSLGAEIYLAAAATLLRNNDKDSQQLICCARYGQPYRNSDPNIGFSVNSLVKNLGAMITLTDPVGLYIQMPQDMTLFQFPSGYQFSDFFTVARGRTRQTAGTSYDQVLHLTVATPAALLARGGSLEQVSINGKPIQWGAQIVETLGMALAATGISSTLPPQSPLPCPTDASSPNPWPQGLLGDAVLKAYMRSDGVAELPPMLPPNVQRGQTIKGLTLVCVDARAETTISFPSGGIQATVTSSYPLQGKAFGTTKIYPMYAFVLTLTVSNDAPLGLATLSAVNPGVTPGPVAAGVLNVVTGS